MTSQNNWYLCKINPMYIHKVPFHDIRPSVWCAMSVTITIPFPPPKSIIHIFLTPILYFTPLLSKMVNQLTLKIIVYIVQSVLGNKTISKRLWPFQSPVPNPCNYYLWGKLQDKAYSNNPHTEHNLTESLQDAVSSVSQTEVLCALIKVFV